MDNIQICLALTLIITFAFLLVYLFYTVYAIFRGAAYVPTPHKDVQQMLAVARPTAADTVMDLGSGDGRILSAFAESGATCIGIEINIFLVWASRLRLSLGGHKNASILCKDFWNVSLKEVTILTLFMVPIRMERLKEKIKKEMAPGAKVVCFHYSIPGWVCHEQQGSVYLYLI